MIYKANNVLKIKYVALHKTTGLVDLTLKTYNPSGVIVDTIVMTEVSGGLYEVEFTPLLVGQYRINISSIANGDNKGKTYEIEAIDLSDVQTNIDANEIKIDLIDSNVDAIKTKTDNLPADTASELTTIKNKIDAVDAQISDGGEIL